MYELQVSMDGAGQPAVVVCFERSPGSIMELPGLSLRGKLQGERGGQLGHGQGEREGRLDH